MGLFWYKKPLRPNDVSAMEKGKKFGEGLFLEALQPFEIPQNRQSFLWKSLEKKGGDLEKLGEKAWRIPGCRSGLGMRALSPRRRSISAQWKSLPRSRSMSSCCGDGVGTISWMGGITSPSKCVPRTEIPPASFASPSLTLPANVHRSRLSIRSNVAPSKLTVSRKRLPSRVTGPPYTQLPSPASRFNVAFCADSVPATFELRNQSSLVIVAPSKLRSSRNSEKTSLAARPTSRPENVAGPANCVRSAVRS